MCPAWEFSSLRVQVDEETMLEKIRSAFRGPSTPVQPHVQDAFDVMLTLNDDDTIEQNSACRGTYPP